MEKEPFHYLFVSAPFNYLRGNNAAILGERNLIACRCTREREREVRCAFRRHVVGKFAILAAKKQLASTIPSTSVLSISVGQWGDGHFLIQPARREGSECWRLRQTDFKRALVG